MNITLSFANFKQNAIILGSSLREGITIRDQNVL